MVAVKCLKGNIIEVRIKYCEIYLIRMDKIQFSNDDKNWLNQEKKIIRK